MLIDNPKIKTFSWKPFFKPSQTILTFLCKTPGRNSTVDSFIHSFNHYLHVKSCCAGDSALNKRNEVSSVTGLIPKGGRGGRS